MRIVIGLIVAFLLGAFCRWLRIPLPAPASLIGVLLIASVTLGFLATDYLLDDTPAPPESASSPPSGD